MWPSRVERATVEYRVAAGGTFEAQLRKFQAPRSDHVDIGTHARRVDNEQADAGASSGRPRSASSGDAATDDPYNPLFHRRLQRLVASLAAGKLRQWQPPDDLVLVWLPAYQNYRLLPS